MLSNGYAMTLDDITCKPEYDQVSQPKFYCPGGGQEVSLVGCDRSCECNNGQLDRAPNTCTGIHRYLKKCLCVENECRDWYVISSCAIYCLFYAFLSASLVASIRTAGESEK